MREIKFRAFDKKKNRIFEVYGLGQDWVTENTLDGVDEGNNCFSGEEFKSRIEIMQFTGLIDKNGKEIYEGDIVNDTELGKGIVVFQSGCFFMMYDADTNMEFLGLKTDRFGRLQEKRLVEILGNIYENPELLK